MKIDMLSFGLVCQLTLFLMSCNLEINTTDPQASSNIAESKTSGFFIAQYHPSPIPDNIFVVEQAWIETVWFNKIVSGKVVKAKSNQIQFNLKLTNFSSRDFANDKYILNWEMKDHEGHGVGTGNGVYILELKGQSIPDSIQLSIYKIGKDDAPSKVNSFELTRQE